MSHVDGVRWLVDHGPEHENTGTLKQMNKYYDIL